MGALTQLHLSLSCPLSPINCLFHISQVKYRGLKESELHTDTISSEFSWLARRNSLNHAHAHPYILTCAHTFAHRHTSTHWGHAYTSLPPHISALSMSIASICSFILMARNSQADFKPLPLITHLLRHTLAPSFKQNPVRMCPDKSAPQEDDWTSVGVHGSSEASLSHTSLILNTLLYFLQNCAQAHWEEIKMSS